jgi:hypothetical protein
VLHCFYSLRAHCVIHQKWSLQFDYWWKLEVWDLYSCELVGLGKCCLMIFSSLHVFINFTILISCNISEVLGALLGHVCNCDKKWFPAFFVPLSHYASCYGPFIFVFHPTCCVCRKIFLWVPCFSVLYRCLIFFNPCSYSISPLLLNFLLLPILICFEDYPILLLDCYFINFK